MGRERKSKEDDNMKKTRISPSLSEDEGKSKRRRRGGEDEENKRKKKKKHKSDKSSKHHSDKELKSDTKHKDKCHKHDRHSKANIEQISTDDYFLKNNEFAMWLKDEKSTFFSDLSSASARELFAQFVEKWNRGKLESRYYEGITTGPRSSHNWKIKQ